jgi:hypothetical protein
MHLAVILVGIEGWNATFFISLNVHCLLLILIAQKNFLSENYYKG